MKLGILLHSCLLSRILAYKYHEVFLYIIYSFIRWYSFMYIMSFSYIFVYYMIFIYHNWKIFMIFFYYGYWFIRYLRVQKFVAPFRLFFAVFQGFEYVIFYHFHPDMQAKSKNGLSVIETEITETWKATADFFPFADLAGSCKEKN